MYVPSKYKLCRKDFDSAVAVQLTKHEIWAILDKL